MIQSDNVLRRVIAKLHLDQDDEFVLPDGNNATLTWIKGALGMLPPPASRNPSTSPSTRSRTGSASAGPSGPS